MAQAVQVSLTGSKGINDVIKALPPALNRRVLLGAQRIAMRPIVKAMKKNLAAQAAEDSGNLMKSIGTKAFKKGGGNSAASITGPRIGGKFKGYHAHLVEKGTKPGLRTAKKGAFVLKRGDGSLVSVKQINHPGTKAKPFAAPAIKTHKAKAIAEFDRALGESVDRVMKSTIRKAGKR